MLLLELPREIGSMMLSIPSDSGFGASADQAQSDRIDNEFWAPTILLGFWISLRSRAGSFPYLASSFSARFLYITPVPRNVESRQSFACKPLTRTFGQLNDVTKMPLV